MMLSIVSNLFRTLRLFKYDKRGVSPIIGFILMLAILIILIAVIITFLMEQFG